MINQLLTCYRKEADLAATSTKLDEEASLVSKLQKQIKELETRYSPHYAYHLRENSGCFLKNS